MSKQTQNLSAFIVAALFGALLPVACGEPTATPADPSITLKLPDVPGVLGDTMVRVRIVAEAPKGLRSVHLYDSTGVASELVLHRDWSLEDRKRFELDTVVRLRNVAGPHILYAVMNHAAGNASQSDTAFTSVQMFRRAAFGFGTPIPDSVFGRSLTVHARVSTTGSAWQLALVMDTGAVGVHVVTGAIKETGLIRGSTDGAGWMNVAFDYPLVLSNGRHRAFLRLTDEHGVRTIGQDFVIHVPAATYTMRVLPGLSIGQAVGRDVSERGDVVGTSVDETGIPRAVVWIGSALPRILRTPVSYPAAHALAINDAGDVAGWMSDGSCPKPVLWHNGEPRPLHLPSGKCGYAVDVNEGGAVLYRDQGYTNTFSTDSAALIDANGVVSRVSNIIGPAAMNDAQQVVGAGPSVWDAVQVPAASFAVPSLPIRRDEGRGIGVLVGVNNNSQVVGYVGQVRSSYTARPGAPTVDLTMDLGGPSSTVLPVWIAGDGTVLAGNGTAGFFIWSQGRTSRVTLATPGWKIVALSRMNGRGQITGEAEETATGTRRAVVLEPLR